MTIEEVNSLLVMSLERIDKLQESLQSSGASAKRHIAMALQKYKNEADVITQEVVDRAILREQIKRELERFEWVSGLAMKYLETFQIYHSIRKKNKSNSQVRGVE